MKKLLFAIAIYIGCLSFLGLNAEEYDNSREVRDEILIKLFENKE